MSHHNYTQLVTPDTCIGDSLATFNSNFLALDDALYKQPKVVSGKGTMASPHISEQNVHLTQVNTNNSFVYNTRFDSYANGATVAGPILGDETTINGVAFPYVNPSSGLGNPTATFSVVSPTNIPPKVTIYWTAAGSEDKATIYSTNRTSTLSSDLGYKGGFNGPVKCLMSVGNVVYVGGDFTAVGDTPVKKFCIISTQEGSNDGSIIGTAGTLVGVPTLYDSYSLSAFNGFGDIGGINAMALYGDLVVFGGSYQSLKNNEGILNRGLGRGLTIWDKQNGYIFPFYVNGEVNTVQVEGIYLYIGGRFDYINYGAQSASTTSGARIYTNGLAKINLTQIQTAPNKSINASFCTNVLSFFERDAIINTIAIKPYSSQSNAVIYIGGRFTARRDTALAAKNLAILNSSGTTSRTWLPIVEGEVNALAINGNYLYVGGRFNSFTTVARYEAAPRRGDEYQNIMGFNINNDPLSPAIEPKWRPKINGPINGFQFHETELNEYVYCYGDFTKINDVEVQHIGAAPKCLNDSDNVDFGQTPINWQIYLDSPCPLGNQNLLRNGSNSLLIGGNFRKVNGKERNYLTRTNGPYEEQQISFNSSYLGWNLAAQTYVPGSSLSLNATNYIGVTATSFELGQLNQTTFPVEYTREIFKNYPEGTLMRFSIQRQSSPVDTLVNLNAYVIGWKLDFN